MYLIRICIQNHLLFLSTSSVSLQVNLFVLLSVVCILLNLAGFILGCQGAQFVSSVPRCDLVSTLQRHHTWGGAWTVCLTGVQHAQTGKSKLGEACH